MSDKKRTKDEILGELESIHHLLHDDDDSLEEPPLLTTPVDHQDDDLDFDPPLLTEALDQVAEDLSLDDAVHEEDYSPDDIVTRALQQAQDTRRKAIESLAEGIQELEDEQRLSEFDEDLIDDDDDILIDDDSIVLLDTKDDPEPVEHDENEEALFNAAVSQVVAAVTVSETTNRAEKPEPTPKKEPKTHSAQLSLETEKDKTVATTTQPQPKPEQPTAPTPPSKHVATATGGDQLDTAGKKTPENKVDQTVKSPTADKPEPASQKAATAKPIKTEKQPSLFDTPPETVSKLTDEHEHALPDTDSIIDDLTEKADIESLIKQQKLEAESQTQVDSDVSEHSSSQTAKTTAVKPAKITAPLNSGGSKPENPFLPKHIRDRLHTNRTLQQEIEDNVPAMTSYSKPPAQPAVSPPSSAKSAPEEKLVDSLMGSLMPKLEQELRQKIRDMVREETGSKPDSDQ